MQADGTINAPGGGFTLGGYRELCVPAGLRPFIEVAWVFESSDGAGCGAGARRRILPETGVSVCLVHHPHGSRRGAGGAQVFLMGPIREPRIFDPGPGTRIEGVRLKPEWCRSFVGIAPEEHVDGFDPAPDPLLERLSRATPLRAPRHPTGMGTLLRTLGACWEHGRPARDAVLAHQALEAMRAFPAAPSGCRARARALGVSDRHLRRLVRSFSGHGMKEFHRVRRLQHAASLAIQRHDPQWARLAVAAGYSDQAHLIREFRDLAGVTPVELREERRALAHGVSDRE